MERRGVMFILEAIGAVGRDSLVSMGRIGNTVCRAPGRRGISDRVRLGVGQSPSANRRNVQITSNKASASKRVALSIPEVLAKTPRDFAHAFIINTKVMNVPHLHNSSIPQTGGLAGVTGGNSRKDSGTPNPRVGRGGGGGVKRLRGGRRRRRRIPTRESASADFTRRTQGGREGEKGVQFNGGRGRAGGGVRAMDRTDQEIRGGGLGRGFFAFRILFVKRDTADTSRHEDLKMDLPPVWDPTPIDKTCNTTACVIKQRGKQPKFAQEWTQMLTQLRPRTMDFLKKDNRRITRIPQKISNLLPENSNVTVQQGPGIPGQNPEDRVRGGSINPQKSVKKTN